MAKLKLEDIQLELEKNKWRLISQEYKNLDTDLEMMCPKGHKIFIPLKKWRKHNECPMCS